jgi:hypothetical protein
MKITDDCRAKLRMRAANPQGFRVMSGMHAMKVVIFAMVLRAIAANAETNSSVTLTFTNAPARPFYEQTTEQKKIEGMYFQTRVNKFDQEVTHFVFNFSDSANVITVLTRHWSVGGKDDYFWTISRTERDPRLRRKVR